MNYQKDFTIRPAKGRFLLPLDIAGKIGEGQECCVMAHDAPVVAFHRGGYFFVPGSIQPLEGVSEATPVAPETQWPKGCEWGLSDWELREVYPPKPVQPAVLIVSLPDGAQFELVAPFSNDTPQDQALQAQYQQRLDDFAYQAQKAYWITTNFFITEVVARWAWQDEKQTAL